MPKRISRAQIIMIVVFLGATIYFGFASSRTGMMESCALQAQSKPLK